MIGTLHKVSILTSSFRNVFVVFFSWNEWKIKQKESVTKQDKEENSSSFKK